MGLLDFLYPPYARCFCCGNPRLDDAGDHVCVSCRESLSSLGKREIFFFVNGMEKVYAAYPYEDAARELIHCLKYAYVREAAKPLGLAMAKSLRRDSFDAMVPVPLHPGRLAERGFNQAELLCKALSAQTNIPVLPALVRLRETGQQAKLERDKRLMNMADAFQPCLKVKGMRLLLVDDVCTTGATAKACSGVLMKAGAKSVSLCVAAVTLKTGRV